MNLVDTHAHLYWDSYKDDLEEVVQRSIDAGVTTVINVGVDVELSKIALRQVQGKLANIPGLTAYSTIGIHPHESIKYEDAESIHQDIAELEKIYQTQPDQPLDSARGRIVAVGECGLDFSSLSDEKQKFLQKNLFQAQIELAKKLNLPLIVHVRDDRSKNPENSECWDEVLSIIGNHPAILHCYSGLMNTTQKILIMKNVLVSFAATITYPKNDYLREAAKVLPMEKIVLETDCPFLPPQSKRGQRNEPANILEIAQLIAGIKGISLEQVSSQTAKNALVFLAVI